VRDRSLSSNAGKIATPAKWPFPAQPPRPLGIGRRVRESEQFPTHHRGHED